MSAAPTTWPPHEDGRTRQKVYRNSAPFEAGEAFFRPLKMETVTHIMRGAERLAVQSLKTRGRGRAKRRHVGELSLCDLGILEALLFKCMDWKSGRCAPTYLDLQELTGHARGTISAALRRLGAAGILQWLRRFQLVEGENGPEVHQAPNAYRFALPRALRKLLGLKEPEMIPDDARCSVRERQRAFKSMRGDETGLTDLFAKWGRALHPREPTVEKVG
jgi:hypothetical protein